MKKDAEHIEKLIETLNEGMGRVRACSITGISYRTLRRWMDADSTLCLSIKKAEANGEDKIKDLAKRGIIEKFQTHWQAAAWWLERNYPEEFSLKAEVITQKDPFDGWTREELQEYARTGKKPARN